jgi:hypothetical protein
MAVYLISYDIASKDRFEYQPIWEWVLVSNVALAATIYEEIAPLTTTADRLLVQEVLKDAV